jgi:hypothetical protein
VEAREVGELDDVDRMHAPVRAEEILAVSRRIEPAVQRDTRRAEASVRDLEILTPAADVPGLDRDVVRIAATGRVGEDLAAGDRIPLAARVVAVADAYFAMCEDRPYRKRRTTTDAVRELQECAGTQFDPRCVEALVAVIDTSA